MTRSVTIVNTSNWEHEDVVVHEFNRGHPPKVTTLKPGDQLVCGPWNQGDTTSLVINGVESKDPIPFKDADGNQNWPKVTVHKPIPSDAETGEPTAGPRLVEQEPSAITVFEWSHFAGDPAGFYVGSKVGYASKNMSLACVGPHESMVCYDAVTEQLRLYGDKVPPRVSIGGEVLHTSAHFDAQTGKYITAPLDREAFRALLVEVRKHHNSHWQAVIDGFDRLPPSDVAA